MGKCPFKATCKQNKRLKTVRNSEQIWEQSWSHFTGRLMHQGTEWQKKTRNNQFKHEREEFNLATFSLGKKSLSLEMYVVSSL